MADGRLTGSVLDHYRVDMLIGRGGMGEVYRALDTTLDRAVALKVLSPEFVGDADSLARFVQEARSASALNHPHVVSIYQIGRAVPRFDGQAGAPSTDTVHYIAMELVSGKTLREQLEMQRMDLKRTLHYMMQAADALSAAHSAGIVHRDFKPDNLMIAEGGYAKVLDFGLAKLRDAAILKQSQTQATAVDTSPGVILGTVGYMSPEQAQGQTADQRSDIFSFGCVLYEAISGVRAFSGKSSVDTLHQIIHSDPSSVAAHMPSAPQELQRIIRKCLSKDPEARYQSMKDVGIDLRELSRQLDPPLSATVPAPESKPIRKPSWLLPLIASLLILSAVAGGFVLTRNRATAPSTPIRIERLTGSGNIIDATISPDGKYIVYVESSGGEQGLWLRQLNGTQPLALAPAARVGFWGIQFSKDSTSVFYAIKGPSFGGGQLFQIPILGGTPRQILSDIDSTISFSPDGKQFAYYKEGFPERGASSLMVADADGSHAHPLATKRPPFFFAPGFFVAPSWSPDGKRIAAGVRNSETRDAGLVTIDASSGAEQVFPDRYLDATFTQWMPDGSGICLVVRPPDRLTVLGGGQIWFQPFPSGAPRPITNDLIDYRNVTISTDKQTLVTIGSDVTPTLWHIPLDPTGEVRRIPSQRADGAAGLAWLPDNRILFTTRVRGVYEIVSMNLDGSNRRELTVDEPNASPAVTPDGKTIVFTSSRRGKRGIWRMNTDGGNPSFITAVSDPSYLAVAPDGRTIFFTSSRDGSSSTWKVSIDGGAPTLVASMFDRAAVSPDGHLLAGVYLDPTKQNFGIAVAQTADGKIVQQFAGLPLTTQGGVVLWTQDGKGILFTSAERTNVWLQRLSGGEPTRVTNFTDQTVFRADRSPDGKSLLAARGNQTRDAFVITNFR